MLGRQVTRLGCRLTSIHCSKFREVKALHTSAIFKNADLYKVLGLTHDATQREIKEAFYALSKLHHPDLSSDVKSHAKFQEISNAYDILGDPHKRMDYDRGLVIPKHSTKPSDFPTKIDPDFLRKADSGSFESHYVRSYNRNLKTAWAQHSDENIAKSAFEYRIDQRILVSVVYLTLFGSIVVCFWISKYFEEPIPLVSSGDS
ncbi:unnamed protein product [Mesocestoides corti]|uniref:DnaJ homolog subfamily B member 9 n=1 Tax=Mesocestoides corti TaxID=53468 RepID=A0A0R3UIL7_MESCO|nr:unnamed protein product [Mesocestoides corti]